MIPHLKQFGAIKDFQVVRHQMNYVPEILYYYLFLHLIIANIRSEPRLQQRCNKEIKYQDGPIYCSIVFHLNSFLGYTLQVLAQLDYKIMLSLRFESSWFTIF